MYKYKLLCQYQENPVGVETVSPVFSWQLAPKQNDILPLSYRVEVADTADFSAVIWTSALLSTEGLPMVEYAGPPLTYSTRYYWRVLITLPEQEASCSPPAFFETTLDPAAWQGGFITAESTTHEKESIGTLLRKEFSAEKQVASARLYATAKGTYSLYLNGVKVGNEYLAPGWTEYKDRLLYTTYDITPYIKQGANVLGAMLGAGWYKGGLRVSSDGYFRYGTTTALLAQLEITYQDGTKEVLITDETWQGSLSPVVYSELYHGETYDASLAQPGWLLPAFDTTAWWPARLESADLTALRPHDGVPITAHEELPALALLTTPQGDTVLDFGQNLTGWVRFRVKGKPGDVVRLRHGEILDAQGNFYTENLRWAKQRIHYSLGTTEWEEYQPYHSFQGFRYLAVDSYPGELALANFTAVVVHSDMTTTTRFDSSHPLLNQLMSNIHWGMKGNFLDIPTDCPQRDERLGWTGDAQVFAKTACYLKDTRRFFTKWLRDMKTAQFPNGGIPNIIPNIMQLDKTQKVGATGWADAMTIIPWTLYLQYGDTALLREMYPAMRGWVDCIHVQAEDGVLWNTGTHFGDWLALDAAEGSYHGTTPNDLVATAFFAYSTQIVAQSAAVLGYTEDVSSYSTLHALIKAAYQDSFFTAQGSLTANTQTAHVLSLQFGLVPEEHQATVVGGLKALLTKAGSLTTGFLGTPYLCHALSDNGLLDEAYQLLLKEDFPSWLYPVTQGATTIWEHWDGLKPDGTMWSADMNSFNHYAYGAVADWILANVGGISLKISSNTAPLRIAPKPGGGLTYANTEYDSLWGTVAVHWRIQDSGMILGVEIPLGATATIQLPGVGGAVTATANHGRLPPSLPLQEFSLTAGSYLFKYPYKGG